MSKKTFWLIALATSVTLIASSVAAKDKSRTLATVVQVDLKQYAGTWYEIARFPNRFQKQCAGEVSATYTLNDNGRIEVVNRCTLANGKTKQAKGTGRVVNKQSNAQLEVRFAPSFLSFLPQVWGDYYIIDLADDYSYAVVGTPDRKYLWVLSRTPQMSDETYTRIIENIKTKQFDVQRLQKTRQNISA